MVGLDERPTRVAVVVVGSVGATFAYTLLLLRRNAAIFGEVVPAVARHNPDGILLVATNPVDALTYVAWKRSGLPARRVIGSGTILDIARLHYLLSWHFGVDPHSVHAFIVGEHGDSEVPVWSLANIAGMRLPAFCAAQGLAYDQSTLDDLCLSPPAVVNRGGVERVLPLELGPEEVEGLRRSGAVPKGTLARLDPEAT